jgi:hypothetical protein
LTDYEVNPLTSVVIPEAMKKLNVSCGTYRTKAKLKEREKLKM